MVTKRKTYVKFEEGNDVWSNPSVCVTTLRGDVLGEITYYRPWRQHVFTPEPYTEFSADCLEDIAAKVLALNVERKALT